MKKILLLLVLSVPTFGQINKPYSRDSAVRSFRALIAANDRDMKSVVTAENEISLVCFADNLPFNYEDRFLTIELEHPAHWYRDISSTNTSTTPEYDAKSGAVNFKFREWENQNWKSVIYATVLGSWYSYGHYQGVVWKPVGRAPEYRAHRDDDDFGDTDVSVGVDDTTFNARQTFQNKNDGTTDYEMTVRLSTGRYTEKWTARKPNESDHEMSSAGTCYSAKTFAKSSTTHSKN